MSRSYCFRLRRSNRRQCATAFDEIRAAMTLEAMCRDYLYYDYRAMPGYAIAILLSSRNTRRLFYH